MIKEIYKSIRTYFIKQRLLDERVLWNDVWWSLLEYGNTIHLRENLSEKTLSTMDSISGDIVSAFRNHEISRGIPLRDITDEERVIIMKLIKANH
jgi:hypothetical protein